MKKSNKRKIISVVVFIVFAAFFAFGAYQAYMHYKNVQTKKEINEHQNEKGQVAIVSTKDVEKMFYKPDKYYRVGHWNILNFGGKSSNKNNVKVQAIAEAIYKTKQDVIGLTEINYGDGDKVQRILDVLNSINNNNSYNLIVQSTDDSNEWSNKGTREQIAIIYNKNKVNLLPFNNSKKGLSYGDTQKFKNEKNEEVSMKRPLYGSLFETIDTKNCFVAFFGHLDSPDVKAKKSDKHPKEQKSQYKDQGTQEIAEAKQIAKAFKFYEQNSPENTSIIFGGDTNIKTHNNNLFNLPEFKDNNIKNYYGNMNIYKKQAAKSWEQYEYYETSLGTKKGYANAYDKLLFLEKPNIDIIDEEEKINSIISDNEKKYSSVSFKADIANGFNNGLWDREKYKKLWQQNSSQNTNYPGDFKLIRTKISDHAPIWVDFVITK
ncbi:MnuA family membrane nuclease [Mycoplasma phocoenae]|uniref:Membrane nuclease MnuA n=1 Tax=Mycoplasma phocoenae TaxID=754517 RepID=A0A858U5C0_9MOLU|nr:hypothetical protein [Mycoplasma phocoenae]QJG67259.1 hypothetical protein HGG69_03065 [Mycoplasma phocoenae]